MSAHFHGLLVCVAKRLPLQALVKFAQVSVETNEAAREAWKTWEAGCVAMGARRMASDKCWMDAYARQIRQQAFRFVDASKRWLAAQEVPKPLHALLCAYLGAHFKMAKLQFFVRRDLEVVNLLCTHSTQVQAVVSSTGEVWRFSETFPGFEATARYALTSVLNEIKGFLQKREAPGLKPILLPPLLSKSNFEDEVRVVKTHRKEKHTIQVTRKKVVVQTFKLSRTQPCRKRPIKCKSLLFDAYPCSGLVLTREATSRKIKT